MSQYTAAKSYSYRFSQLFNHYNQDRRDAFIDDVAIEGAKSLFNMALLIHPRCWLSDVIKCFSPVADFVSFGIIQFYKWN